MGRRYFPLFLTLAMLAACDRERREPRPQPIAETGPALIVTTQLYPGEMSTAIADERGSHYQGNAYHLSEGKRLFTWFNCVGCHGNGGGGSGPALMDEVWLYGGDIDQIYASIVQGRPNGMPTFRNKIPEQQVWQLAAYVKSLSGNVPADAAPSRADQMSVKPPEARIEELPQKDAAPPASSEGRTP